MRTLAGAVQNVLQLEAAGRDLLAELARRAPLLPGADVLAFVDIDSTQKRVCGHKKQGAGFGHTKIQGKTVLVRGLNALAATICTPQAAPVIAATRLRGGSANTARGAAQKAPGTRRHPRSPARNRTSRRTSERQESHGRPKPQVQFVRSAVPETITRICSVDRG